MSEAEQIHKHYVLLWRLGLIGMLFIALVSFLVFFMWLSSISLLYILPVFLICIIASYARTAINKHAENNVRKILLEDCDPELAIQVFNEFKTDRNVEAKTIELNLTEAYLYAGDYQKAKKGIKSLYMDKWRADDEVRFVRILGLFAFFTKDGDEFDEAKKDLSMIYHDKSWKTKQVAGRDIDITYELFRKLIYLEQGSYSEVSAYKIEEQVLYPPMLYRVLDSFFDGLSYLCLGEFKKAFKSLNFVVEHGNKLCIVRIAEKLIHNFDAGKYTKAIVEKKSVFDLIS